VQFVLKRDDKKRFSFASLQSEIGQSLLVDSNLGTVNLSSIILIQNGKTYTESTAALLIAKELGGAWPLLSAFLVVPKFIRDGVYRYISKNRYKWFGKKEVCWLPNEDYSSRFL
jgi:predicted DCC family thiol-disulfide oxidoreductase YuxK